VADEIGVGAGHVSRCDDKAVAAAAREHLFERVRDLPGSADDRIRGLAAAAEGDKIRALGLLLPEVFSTPSRMPRMPCMPCSSSVVSGSSMPLEAKVVVQSLRQ